MKKILGLLLTLTFLVSFTTISLGESYVMHTVAEGDTYWELSNTYNENVDSLLDINQTSDVTLLAGDFIKISAINRNIEIFVDGVKLSPDANPYLENDRTFVPIRSIAEALDANIEWQESTSTATITTDDKSIQLPVGSKTASVNGSSYAIDAAIKIYDGRIFVPVRFISEVLGSKVAWDQQNYRVNIQKTDVQTNNTYSEEDLYWLSRIVSAEAKGESYEGKLAVANVIINRKNSVEYPNTIKGVIFDTKFSVQFTPISNGTIYNAPTNDSISAAKEALQGTNNIGESLFFLNESKSTYNWIQTNRPYYTTIGEHTFYL